jgi:hypothetical protein
VQRAAHLHFLICREHVWHLSRIQDVVDVLNKRLILDLAVTEQEHDVLGITACTPQQPLEVFTPLCAAVALADLNLSNTNKYSQ